MIKGFKEFIARGDVIEFAVAVTTGAGGTAGTGGFGRG